MPNRLDAERTRSRERLPAIRSIRPLVAPPRLF
jgi:hypothetical protein